MSRSKPNEGTPNPATCWFEWKGKIGKFVYWDKQKEQNIEINLPFAFILLDRTATIRGYNPKAKSGIFSNEVRDTRSDAFIVKYFTGGLIAEGLWSDIKDRVTVNKGKFAVNAYIAFKQGDTLKIGALQLSGCALGPWFEFEKAHRKPVDIGGGNKVQEIFAKAISVSKTIKGKTGDNEYLEPVFSIKEIDPATNAAAIELDKQLQEYFDGYFKRSKVEQTDRQPDADDIGRQPEPPEGEPLEGDGHPESDDVPF